MLGSGRAEWQASAPDKLRLYAGFYGEGRRGAGSHRHWIILFDNNEVQMMHRT